MKKIDFKKAIQDKTKSIPVSLMETEEKIKSQIIILDEIRDFISPLSVEELSGLERTLLEEGITDPLILWETSPQTVDLDSSEALVYVLIDGHHRYGISKKHGLDFRFVIRNYNSMDEVKSAMLDKQLNRRNLTPEQISYYRGLKYNRQKATQVGTEKTVNVATALAKEFGVNEKTIRRDAAFASGLDKLATPLKQEVLAGDKKLPKSTISSLAKLAAQTTSIDSIQQLESIIKDDNTESIITITTNNDDSAKVSSIKSFVKEKANSDFNKNDCAEMIKQLNELMKLL